MELTVKLRVFVEKLVWVHLLDKKQGFISLMMLFEEFAEVRNFPLKYLQFFRLFQ